MYLVKTPKFIQNLFPNFTWRIPTKEKVLYLTFDDGPIPEVTPMVLEQLFTPQTFLLDSSLRILPPAPWPRIPLAAISFQSTDKYTIFR